MRLMILAAAMLALVSCGSNEPEVIPEKVENAWVRLPAVTGRPAAAYFELYGGEEGDTLIAVESTRVGRIELHETTEEDGAMRMRAIGSVEVPAGETVSFVPGGLHAMLFETDTEITPGTPLPLNFRFDSGRDVQVDAVTIAAGNEAPFASEGEDGEDGGEHTNH